jgi:anti-sigma B factor antagonist
LQRVREALGIGRTARRAGVDQDFEIVESGTEAVPVIAVSGEIDVATAPQLREVLHRVIAEGGSTVVLDLLGVTFLDSTALGVLVGALKRCRETGGDLQVVVADPRIMKIFEITGLTNVFTITDSLEAAGAS